MTMESTSARILRELTARQMTRRELAEMLGLSAGAISIQVAKLQAMRVIVVAGNVRAPSGVGYVLAFRAAPDAAAIFEARASEPPQPRQTAARLELLAMLAVPRTIPELAAECACMVDTMTKRVMHLERAGLVRRTGARGRGRGLPLRWIAVEVPA